MSMYNVVHVLAIGFIFHLVFIYSVFDCYFTSPVVHGMQPFNAGQGEAKRVVLIVGDGLRADLLFMKNGFANLAETQEVVAPHLRDIVETRGAFGVSHTRVPTESRPGHVAIIAGMYEDVSAVTKGWKMNPVDFDSLFNQSVQTFSFGSPDILPMFAHGASPGKVRMWYYDEDEEDFTRDATALDTWVLTQLETLFRNATNDGTLQQQLNSDRVIFFLHLLGLDTTGHSYRPHSLEYMRNIRVVDSLIAKTEKLMNEFYKDRETAYIFTADHGMSFIGNHGDGHPDNTRTPLIVWGKGFRGPILDSDPTSHDEYSTPWELGRLFRRDIEQADLAPLIATVAGINWPVNSVGVLPDADPSRPGFLSPSEGGKNIAFSAFTNARVLIEHYQVKHYRKKANTIFYRPFIPLEKEMNGIPARIQALENITMLIEAEEWALARRMSLDYSQLTLRGIRYLDTYHRPLLTTLVTISYLGWIAYSSLFVFRPQDLPYATLWYPNVLRSISVLVFAVLTANFIHDRLSWRYAVYAAFPCFFWGTFFTHTLRPLQARLHLSATTVARAFFSTFIILSILWCMTLGYTVRAVWSAGYVLIGLCWPLFLRVTRKRTNNLLIDLVWGILCCISAIFPMLSLNRPENLGAILSGGGLMMGFGILSAALAHNRQRPRLYFWCTVLQTLLILVACFVTYRSSTNLRAKQGLKPLDQLVGWATLLTSPLLPVLMPSTAQIASRFLMYSLAYAPCFIMLSINTEGLFYVTYCATLYTWVHIEKGHLIYRLQRHKHSQYAFQSDDIRIVLFLLFFVQVGFFGTGNVASISSFYLEPVYRLIPTFSPFSMASLLLFKILNPYVLLAVAFAVVNHTLHLPPFSLFTVSLMLTDVMTSIFFYKVTDEGSWLEIGQSISFFIITSLLLIWSGMICVLGEYLLSDLITCSRTNAESPTLRSRLDLCRLLSM